VDFNERTGSMTSSKRGAALTAAAALAILGVGAGAGAGLYASLAPASTTTVVNDITGGQAEQTAATSGLTINGIYQRSYQGVVDIVVDSSSSSSQFGFGGTTQTTQAEGSGFVYDYQGDIITNEHVVSGATSITVKLWNGKTFKGHLVGSDSSTDLAVVKISAPSSLLHPLSLGNSDTAQVGDPVVAIGSPFGLAETVTSGIVSALHRTIDSPNNFTIGDSIQTDAPINHGNSGGPLLNAQGQVIGVTAQIQSDSGGSDGVGFAIPVNTIKQIAGQIVSGKSVAHAYFGVRVEDSTTPPGADLAQILPGTPAAKAGLKDGDVVVKLDGKSITGQSDLSAVIDSKKPGDKMSVTFVRNSQARTIVVTLTARPA
jgi:putative serine protease PepD